MSRRSPPHASIEVALRGLDPAVVELAEAEVWEVGAEGIEERDSEGEGRLIVYAPAVRARAVRAALAARLGDAVGETRPVAEADWSVAWREGLEAIEIGRRLRVRPSWLPPCRDGRIEIVIDPGAAFGTGGHASTRLVLEWLDVLARAPGFAGARVLDVGTGTGVLAIAALCLGAKTAIAFDLDPASPKEAMRWAERNAVADRLRSFRGPIAALAGEPFDLALVNMLSSETRPILEAVARALAPGGRAIFSGLLTGEADAFESALRAAGLVVEERREARDASDDWLSLLTARA